MRRGQLSAQILRGAPQPFGLQIAQHEFGILGADRLLLSVTLPPPNTLISSRSREHPALISSLMSFSIAKLPKRVDCGSPPQPPAWPCGKHEMIHAADAASRIADAGRDARAEHRDQHLVGFRRDVEFAGKDLHHPGRSSRRRRIAAPRRPGAVVGIAVSAGCRSASCAAHASLR